MSALRAVVTGASSGMGAETVRRLRALDWDVVAVARREEELRALAEETGCDWIVADMTSDESVAAMAEQVLAGGPVNSLVANAGAAFMQMAKDQKLSEGMQRRLSAGSKAPGWVRLSEFDWYSTLPKGR